MRAPSPRVHVMADIERPTPIRPSFTRLSISPVTDGPAENALYDFLKGGSAAAIFEAHGFDDPAPRTSP
jgi:hypothetical protein